jgi:hypothetical protein
MLQTRQPALFLEAIARILQGSAPRAVNALVVLTPALTLGWIILASLGRAATLTMLFEFFCDGSRSPRWRLTSLMGLNFLRAVAFLAAVVGSVGAVLVAGAASSQTDPSPGSALLIFWMLVMFVGLAWSMLDWFLSLAAIFVVGDGRTTFGALSSAADLCRDRPGAVIAAATWFGVAHTTAFIVASSAAAFPLGFAQILPGGVVLGGVILVILIYLAIADLLYVGRLAAYVFLIESPESTQLSALSIQPSDDDILSDVPSLIAPPEPAS